MIPSMLPMLSRARLEGGFYPLFSSLPVHARQHRQHSGALYVGCWQCHHTAKPNASAHDSERRPVPHPFPRLAEEGPAHLRRSLAHLGEPWLSAVASSIEPKPSSSSVVELSSMFVALVVAAVVGTDTPCRIFGASRPRPAALPIFSHGQLEHPETEVTPCLDRSRAI